MSDDGDDDLSTAVSFLSQFLAQQQHTFQMLAAANYTAFTYRNRHNPESSEEEELQTKPGRGNTLFTKKATYVRRDQSKFYTKVGYHDADTYLFKKITHLTASEFDALHDLVAEELSTLFNIRKSFPQDNRVPKKRKLDTRELLFFLFDVLGGSNEGGRSLEHMAVKYDCSTVTVSNHFRHALFALRKSLDAAIPKPVRWPNAEERLNMGGLVIGFPSCVFFVDGTKNKRSRTGDNDEQERSYDGYKKSHCFSILVFCDIFESFITVETTDHGEESDHFLYTSSDVYRNPKAYLSHGQHGVADLAFAGEGKLVVPYESTESTLWLYRTDHNRDIRKQQIVSEWGIGFINNRFGLFLGCWPFEMELLSIAYYTAAMISNWPFDRHGYSLQTRKCYCATPEIMERPEDA